MKNAEKEITQSPIARKKKEKKTLITMHGG